MSAEDVDLVRRSIEMFLAGRVDEAIELYYKPDGVFISRYGALEGGTYVGLEGAQEYLALMDDAWEQYDRELEDVIDGEDSVVAILTIKAKARASGVEVERRIGMAYWLEDGRIAKMVSYPSVEEARDAVGLKN